MTSSVRKYYHKCTECSEVTYYCPEDKEMCRPRVVDKDLTETQKRTIYMRRYRAKKRAEKEANMTQEELEAKQKRQNDHIQKYYDNKRDTTPCLLDSLFN